MEGIYFINTPELENRSLFKIGWSQNMYSRLKQLQTGNGYKLILYNYIITSDRKLETKIHASLSQYRKQGEWFSITESDVDKIVGQYENKLETNEVSILDNTDETTTPYEFETDINLEIEKNDNIIEEEIKPVLDLVEETTITKKVYKNRILLSCPKCNKTFSKEGYLENHLNQANPCDKPITCKKCGAVFKTVQNLNQHRRRKTDCSIIKNEQIDSTSETKISQKCPLCENGYYSISDLKKHMKVCGIHNNKSKTCKYCGKTYTNKSFFNKHTQGCSIRNDALNNIALLRELQEQQRETKELLRQICALQQTNSKK